MDTSFTVILLTNIAMGSALFVYNYYDVILDILINGVNCSKITKSKVNSNTILSVNSDYGKLYLNKIKVPSDIDIYFFKQNFNVENGIMSKKVFSLLHNNKKFEQLTKYRDNLIISFRTSYDINGTDTLLDLLIHILKILFICLRLNQMMILNILETNLITLSMHIE